MPIHYSADPLGNLLARGTTTVNPAASTLFPSGGLFDDDEKPAQFGSIAADSYIAVHNNLLINPGAETALGAEWVSAVVAPGTFARSAVNLGRGGAGTYAFTLNGHGGAGIGKGYQSFSVRAGERARLDGWCLAGVGKYGQLRVFNPTTNHWLVNGAWQSAEGDAVTAGNSASYARVAETLFQVEDLTVCLYPEVTLQVYLRTTENAAVLWDDISISPAINAAIIYGHNIRPCVTPQLLYSDDGFVADSHIASSPTLQRPSFYSLLTTPIYREWWRIKLTGTNTVAPWITEAWLGYLDAFDTGPIDGWSLSILADGVVSDGGWQRVSTVDDPAIELQFTFRHWTAAQWRAFANELYRRSKQGARSIAMIVELGTAQDCAMIGRLAVGPLSMRWQDFTTWDYDLTIRGMKIGRMLS
jgi:hypothetical protein